MEPERGSRLESDSEGHLRDEINQGRRFFHARRGGGGRRLAEEGEVPSGGAGAEHVVPTSVEQFEEIARRAAKEDTIVMVCCNEGYLEFFRNWAAFVEQLGYTDRLLVFADDVASYEHVHARWPGHAVFQLPVAELNSSGGAGSSFHAFGSQGFFEFSRRRPYYIRSLLHLGLSVLYSDLDMVWLQDPFPYFTGGFDVYLEDDSRKPKDAVEPMHAGWAVQELQTYHFGNLCSCLLFVRPTPAALLLLSDWALRLRATRYHGSNNDQPHLNMALRHLYALGTKPRVGLLPPRAFPAGWLYFGGGAWRAQARGRISVVHNNWISKSKCKKHRFKEADLWLADGDSDTFVPDPNCRAAQ